MSRPCRSCRCSSPSTSMLSHSKHARYPRIFTTTNFVYWPYIQYPVYWYDLCMPHPTGRKTKSTESSVSIIPVSSPSINTLSGSKRARYPSIYYQYYNLPVICDTQYTGGTHPVPSVLVRSLYVSPRNKEQSIESSVSTMPVFIAVYQHAFALQARPVPTHIYYYKLRVLAAYSVSSLLVRSVHASPNRKKTNIH